MKVKSKIYKKSKDIIQKCEEQIADLEKLIDKSQKTNTKQIEESKKVKPDKN